MPQSGCLIGIKLCSVCLPMKLSYPPQRPSLKPALRAVLSGRADLACAEIAARGAGARVHELRKRSKEIRGLLRLLRGGWEDAGQWNACIRDAAAKLAPARDADVMLATFDNLTARRRSPSDFDSLRQILLDEAAISRAATEDDPFAYFAATMAEFSEAAQKLDITGKTPATVWRNAAHIWAQGARDFRRAAQAGADASVFHDWRKRVKHHWYQARFFKPIDRARLRGHIACVDALGKTLGAHNDLDVLHQYLHATSGDTTAFRRLEPDMITARATAAHQALRMGAALYATDPTQDWPTRWQAWRTR